MAAWVKGKQSIQVLAAGAMIWSGSSIGGTPVTSRSPSTEKPISMDRANGGIDSVKRANEASLSEAAALRAKSTQKIQKLLSKETKAPARFELMCRLGALQLEEAEYQSAIEYAAFDQAYDAFIKGGSKGAEPKIGSDRSRQAQAAGIKIFEEIVKTYGNQPRGEGPSLQLGKLYAKINDPRAEAQIVKFLAQYPKSSLQPEGLLALAELHFDRRNFAKAESSYLQMLTFRGHSLYRYALYKLGWTYYNLGFAETAQQNTWLEKFLGYIPLRCPRPGGTG